MPQIAILAIQAFQAAITAAPQVEALVVKAKDYLSEMFSAGLITKEQQNALHAHVDSLCAAFLAGNVPPEFTVED